MHQAIRDAGAVGIELGERIPSIPAVLEMVFRRTYALWIHAAAMVDQLDADLPPQPYEIRGKSNLKRHEGLWVIGWDANGNRVVEQSKWPKLEATLRAELFEQGARMTQLKLDERRVRVEEAQLEMLALALDRACEHIKLAPGTRKRLGRALRNELTALEPEQPEKEQLQLPNGESPYAYQGADDHDESTAA